MNLGFHLVVGTNPKQRCSRMTVIPWLICFYVTGIRMQTVLNYVSASPILPEASSQTLCLQKGAVFEGLPWWLSW